MSTTPGRAPSRERKSKSRWVLSIALLLGSGGSAGAGVPIRPEYDLGILLAMNGEVARAESVFVSLLSQHPGDAAAFTNLGNLRLLEGDPELALAFYRRAGAADSADAGIALNQATALLLMGEDAEAESLARLGVGLAGGPRAAASLLGLHFEDRSERARAAEGARLSQEEVRAMLRTAAGHVPADSARGGARPDSIGAGAGRKRGLVWRPAGPRAEDSQTPPTFVHWKR